MRPWAAPLAAAALCASLAAVPAWGQSHAASTKYPWKPITLVVPYPPGGSNDLLARTLAARLSDAWRIPVRVENRSGDTGVEGAAMVARAPADGHTICLLSSSFTTHAALHPRLPFDPLRAFAPVGFVAKAPMVLAVANAVPARTTLELFDLARRQPGKLRYGSSGVGSSNHFATELLMDAAGIQMTHVPFAGMQQAVSELTAGRVDVLLASPPSIYAHVKEGRVRAIGLTSGERSALIPGLEPIASMGLPSYRFSLWWGLAVPRGTPAETVMRLNADLNRILRSEEVRRAFLDAGAEPAPSLPGELGRAIADDIAAWKKVARSAGIRPD